MRMTISFVLLFRHGSDLGGLQSFDSERNIHTREPTRTTTMGTAGFRTAARSVAGTTANIAATKAP